MSRTRQYTIRRWCELFGIELVDDDGFRDEELTMNDMVDIDRFVDGMVKSTICPVDKERYAHLVFLMDIL